MAKELLREAFPTRQPFHARRRIVAFYDHYGTVDGDELDQLARHPPRGTTILRWHRTGLTNGPTEGQDLVIKNIKRRSVYGFWKFDNNRFRLPHRRRPGSGHVQGDLQRRLGG